MAVIFIDNQRPYTRQTMVGVYVMFWPTYPYNPISTSIKFTECTIAAGRSDKVRRNPKGNTHQWDCLLQRRDATPIMTSSGCTIERERDEIGDLRLLWGFN